MEEGFIYWTEQFHPEGPEGWYQVNECCGHFDLAKYWYDNIEQVSRKPVQLVRYYPPTHERVVICWKHRYDFEIEIDWKREGF